MESRLYVGNLSDDVSVESLRKRFAEFGRVSDVYLASDRASGRLRGHAFVTMASAQEAQAAITNLNGSLFDDRRLRVNIAGDESSRSRSDVAERARITSQFRERLNMAYELDCDGVFLAIRMFPEDASEKSWRIEASVRNSPVVAASAPTRGAALEKLACAWQAQGMRSFDWPAITQALAAVRAI